MATITTKGRLLLTDMYRAGFDCEWHETGDILETLSLIARHAKTSRRLCEIMCSGHPVYGGEWVNAHAEWLEKRDEQTDRHLKRLAGLLPATVRMETGGDPRGWVVRLIVTDERGIERTVGVD